MWGDEVGLAFCQLYENDFEERPSNSILNTNKGIPTDSSFALYGSTLINYYVIWNNKPIVNQSLNEHNT